MTASRKDEIMINKMSWSEFREAGMLWWINTILHMFGWAIVYNFDENKEISEVYPARVKFRGFGEKETEAGYKQVSSFLQENAAELYKESCE